MIVNFIIESNSNKVSDTEITRLLTDTYVGGGYSTPERGAEFFVATKVRSRGELISATTQDGIFVGMVIVVRPDAPAKRIAEPDEAEIHLLGVDPNYRRHGIGRLLMTKAIDSILGMGFRKVILWTQPSMKEAHRLYESMGFVRAKSRDPMLDGIDFLAYVKSLSS